MVGAHYQMDYALGGYYCSTGTKQNLNCVQQWLIVRLVLMNGPAGKTSI